MSRIIFDHMKYRNDRLTSTHGSYIAIDEISFKFVETIALTSLHMICLTKKHLPISSRHCLGNISFGGKSRMVNLLNHQANRE